MKGQLLPNPTQRHQGVKAKEAGCGMTDLKSATITGALASILATGAISGISLLAPTALDRLDLVRGDRLLTDIDRLEQRWDQKISDLEAGYDKKLSDVRAELEGDIETLRSLPFEIDDDRSMGEASMEVSNSTDAILILSAYGQANGNYQDKEVEVVLELFVDGDVCSVSDKWRRKHNRRKDADKDAHVISALCLKEIKGRERPYLVGARLGGEGIEPGTVWLSYARLSERFDV